MCRPYGSAVGVKQPALAGSAHGAHSGGIRPLVSWLLWQARPICLRLFEHFIRLAASRIFWTAGRSRPIRMAMMAITTNNSMSVKPRRLDGLDMRAPGKGMRTCDG